MNDNQNAEIKEKDLYDILALIWNNKFKIFIVPIIISAITFTYFDKPKKIFNYENEIFFDRNKLSKISGQFPNFKLNIDQKVQETCRSKYKFLDFIKDTPQFENMLELINDKKMKCKFDERNNTYKIIISNSAINEQFLLDDLKIYPSIFFEFINEEVSKKIKDQIQINEELNVKSQRKRIAEISDLIELEKRDIKFKYEQAIQEAKIHLEVANENNIIQPLENAPGFGKDFNFFADEKLFMNGVNALKVFISSLNERYQQDILNSATLEMLKKEKNILELQLLANEDSSFISSIEVLKFSKNNEYLDIVIKPSYIFLIVLFLSIGILIISLILFEGYRARADKKILIEK